MYSYVGLCELPKVRRNSSVLQSSCKEYISDSWSAVASLNPYSHWLSYKTTRNQCQSQNNTRGKSTDHRANLEQPFSHNPRTTGRTKQSSSKIHDHRPTYFKVTLAARLQLVHEVQSTAVIPCPPSDTREEHWPTERNSMNEKVCEQGELLDCCNVVYAGWLVQFYLLTLKTPPPYFWNWAALKAPLRHRFTPQQQEEECPGFSLIIFGEDSTQEK